MSKNERKWSFGRSHLLAVVAISFAMTVAGCGSAPGTGSGSDSDVENVLLSETLGFDGQLSGKILDSSSTRESLNNGSTAQSVPPEFDTSDTCVRFRDLEGNDLLDVNGNPIPEVPMDPDGSFSADNLPVGVDFTVCGDIGKDGFCEIESCVNIASEDGGENGTLEGIEVDPLTTLVLAKLRELIEESGINIEDLPISPVAVVTRIVDAYHHLFEESGVDIEITLADIENVLGDELAELFDSLVPAGARAGMDSVEGNLEYEAATDLNGRALSIAKVFLKAGFPIGDGPGDLDLSPLGEIEGVEVLSESDFFAGGDPFVDDFAEFDEGLGEFLEPAEFEGDSFGGFTVYVNTFAEPDRNFGGEEGEGGGEHGLPLIHDYLLIQMARLQFENRVIKLDDLYELLTSIENGLGARLTYFIFDPNFHGPPLDVFETADGEGKALNLEILFARLFSGGFQNLTPEEFDRREDDFRVLLADLLRGTIPPTYDRLFGAIPQDRIGSVEEFSETIRRARAHVPFSRSGPSEFFVVADGDFYRGDENVSAITVDLDTDIDGLVHSVTYNSEGTGAFWLGFTFGTDEEGFVEFIVRETGRFFHGRRGPVRLNMNNADTFQSINGQPFIDFVSEFGFFYPGTSVSVIRDEYVPEAVAEDDFFFFDEGDFFFEGDHPDEFIEDDGFAGDDEFIEDDEFLFEDDEFFVEGDEFVEDDTTVEDGTVVVTDEGEAPPARELDEGGPNEQLFVLATGLGEGSEPVRVDYDPTSGTAIFNPAGRHLLMFLPDSDQTGLFALFNESTGRPAGEEDPALFFDAPQEQPERFEDFYNNFDDQEFMEFEDFSDFDEFVDGFIDDVPQDGFFIDPETGEVIEFVEGDEFGSFDDEFVDDGGDAPLEPAEFVEGEEFVEGDEFFEDEFTDFAQPEDFDHPDFDILVSVFEIQGLDLRIEEFNHVFGANVPNERYDPSGDPFYDDINGNGQHDADEPTAQFRPLLFDPSDWRSTDIRLYYRRASNNASVTFDDINFESETPQAADGDPLVPRNYLPRLNAFRFSRPNSAINLLTAFLPPDFFNGTHSLSRESSVSVLTAIAMINLVMDQVFNVEADIDVDGLGPLPEKSLLIDAHLFVAPIGDPFVLLIDGFGERSFVRGTAE